MIKALLAPLSLCGKMQCEARGQERKRGNALSYSSPDRRIQMAVVVSTCLLYRVLGSKGVLYLRREPEIC